LAALLLANPASASSILSAHGSGDTPHACKCASKCRSDSCCCGPHEKQSRLPEPGRAPDSKHLDATSPCQMNSAPCGDSGLPNEPSERRIGKCANFELLGQRELDTLGELLHLTSHSPLPISVAGRVDRPPEDFVLA
jgi:hypothetical protein